MQIYMLVTTINANGELTFAILLVAPFLIGIFTLWRCSNNIEPCSAAILIIGFIIGMLFEMTRLPSRTGETAFYLGYAYATIQRAVQTHLVHYQWVMATGVATIIVRSAVLGVGQVWIYVAHVFLDIFVHYECYKYEVIDRTMFSSLKKSEEQLMKFKNLLVALPTAIITVSKNLENALFVNDIFKNEIGTKYDYSKPSHFLEQFMMRLEDLSLMRRSTLPPGESPTGTLKEKILGTLEKDKNLPNQLTFNVTTMTMPRRVYEVKVLTMSWDGEEAIAIIFQDNTDQESLFALKADHAHKDKVIDSISHELRTPLSAITGILQIMEDQIVPKSPMALNLDMLKKNANLLNNIINCILDLQLVRSNKIILSPSKFNLRELLLELLDQFQFSANSKNLKLRVDIPYDVNPEINTDRNRLMQVILSLVGNSVKFTQQGGVLIKVKNDALDPKRLVIWVEDTGQGIRPEDQEKLFGMYGPFYESSHPKDMKAGVGLGLTISKCLAKELNGKKESLELKQSDLNIGTTFGFKILKHFEIQEQPEQVLIDIPDGKENIDESFSEGNKSTSVILGPVISELKKLDSRPQLEDTNSVLLGINNHSASFNLDPSPRKNLIRSDRYFGTPEGPITQSKQEINLSKTETKSDQKKTILVVDDSPYMIKIVTNFLSDKIYNIYIADNGQAAIDTVRSLHATNKGPDLVVMDIQMPIMDGYEATKQLKELMKKKELPEIPIIALTANDREEDKARSREVGMDLHLSKPFKKEQLLSAVKQYI